MEVPIGTIIAFGGDVSSLPDNYLLCDGKAYDHDGEYNDLYKVISNYWGGDKVEFNVPDLRGLFLRGVNGSRDDAWKDPDANDAHYRVAMKSGSNPGNMVGSVQADALAPHQHQYVGVTGAPVYPAGSPNGIVPDPNPQYTSVNKGVGTSSETRPKNAYVYWIIKAK